MEASTLTSAARTSDDANQHVESWEFLQPDPKFERVLRYAKGTTSRIWLFYHAAHLEAFGRTAPYRAISDEAIDRVCAILGEDVPNPFKNPEDRRTFTHHADKARQALDWRRLDRKLRSEVQEWLSTQAERSDDHDYLHEVLEERLRFDRIVFPATTTLERTVGQARTEGQERIIARSRRIFKSGTTTRLLGSASLSGARIELAFSGSKSLQAMPARIHSPTY